MGILFNSTGKKTKTSSKINFLEFYTDYFNVGLEEAKNEGFNGLADLDTTLVFAKKAFNPNNIFKSYLSDNNLSKEDLVDIQDLLMTKQSQHPLVYRENGTVNLKETWANLSDEQKGEAVMSTVSVSYFSTKRVTEMKIGPLVPLYYAAHKMYNNIPYSKFICTENTPYHIYFVNQEQLKLLQYQYTEDGVNFFSGYPDDREVIDRLRKELFYWGKNLQDYRTFHQPSRLEKFDIDKRTPHLAIHIALQSWAAYPGNWKDTFNEKYALLNPLDWDTPPEPIWGDEEEVEVKTFKFGRSGKSKW